MQYDQESAGGIMNPDVVSVLKDQTIDQAIQSIRTYIEQEEMENFYAVYVTDEYQHLIGIVSLPQLLLSNRNTLINELMNPNVVAVDVDMDQEDVARIAQEYNLVVVPVINKYLKLIGRITSDDVMHVLQDEYQEDIAHIAGTGSEEVLETSVLRTSRDRLPWLILGLIGGIFAASAMGGYEKIFSELPQIIYFVPLIAAIGGNIAIQSSSIVVRGLGTGQIRQTDLLSRLWKELRVSSINGPICAGILFLVAWFLAGFKIGVITGIALIAVVMMATIVGSAVPIILKRINIDPAIATGPFITTANDLVGILIYLSIALALIDLPIEFN